MNTTKLAISFVSALALITLVFGYFIAWPLYQDWQTAQAKLTRINKELKTAKEHRLQAKDIVAVATTIHEKSIAAKQLIPIAEERESFISEYDALAKQLSLTLSVLNFQKSTPTKTTDSTETAKKKAAAKKATTDSVHFTSNITGSYSNVRQLVSQIRTMRRYATITSLTIVNRELDTTASIDGEIYLQPEPKTPDTVKVGPKIWDYLSKRTIPTTAEPGLSTGRTDPFAAY